MSYFTYHNLYMAYNRKFMLCKLRLRIHVLIIISCAGGRHNMTPPRDLDLWPWKWCPSHVWRWLPLWQF